MRGLNVVVLALVTAATAVAQSPITFTSGQATRGAALYQERCAECHGDEAQGDGNGITPPLASLEFRGNWGGLPLSTLLDRIRQEGQQGSKAALTRQQETDILAFILARNQVPAGEQELPSDPAALSRIPPQVAHTTLAPARLASQVSPLTSKFSLPRNGLRCRIPPDCRRGNISREAERCLEPLVVPHAGPFFSFSFCCVAPSHSSGLAREWSARPPRPLDRRAPSTVSGRTTTPT